MWHKQAEAEAQPQTNTHSHHLIAKPQATRSDWHGKASLHCEASKMPRKMLCEEVYR